MAEKKELEINAENIEEIIKTGETVTEDIAKVAAQKIADKRKEQLTEDYIKVITKAEWTQKKIALQMKHSKKSADIRIDYTKAFTGIRKKLTDGDKSVGISEYDKLTIEARDLAKKRLRENDTWLEEQNKVLNAQYPESHWDWKYDNLLV